MKLAIYTHDSALFHLVQSCLIGDDVICTRYSEDVDLARALHREEFSAIVFDASAGMDASHPVLVRRACYGDRRAPLIAIGEFFAHDQAIAALSAGADDIVLKPVDPRELRLRFLLAVHRFTGGPAESGEPQPTDDEIGMGIYRLSRRNGSVEMNGKDVRLTTREFAIAWVLFSQQGSYVTRRAIAATVWGSSEEIVGRTLEQHIYKLRKKLLLDGACGIVLRTMYAHGYRIERVVERVMGQVVEPAKARLLRTPTAAPSKPLTSDSEAACNT